jgi:hypothetical protein
MDGAAHWRETLYLKNRVAGIYHCGGGCASRVCRGQGHILAGPSSLMGEGYGGGEASAPSPHPDLPPPRGGKGYVPTLVSLAGGRELAGGGGKSRTYTAAEYISETTGVMPACGYDAHVPCVPRAAKLLVEQRGACGDTANGHRGSGSRGHGLRAEGRLNAPADARHFGRHLA